MKYTKISLAFFCCILWISSATNPEFRQFDTRIVGGSSVAAAQYPYIASLQRGSGNHYCGGSILRKASPAIILTAAHCAVITDVNTDFVRLYADDVQGSNVGEYIDSGISKVIVHPNYDDQNLQNDIALVVLSEDISSYDHLETVIISPLTEPSDECCADNERLQAIGYGRDCAGCALTQTLEALDVRYIENTECAATLAQYNAVTHSMLCAGAVQGEAVCNGDSGGPLMSYHKLMGKEYQIGLVSWGIPCALGLPDAYTEIGYFYEWIIAEVYESECVSSCAGVSDGNYQSCQGCSGYASCSEGILSEMRCPSPLVWDDIKQMCVFSSYTCGLPLLDICEWITPNVGQCVPDCAGVVNGQYQSCETCNGYVSCCEGMIFERECAPSNPPLVWNDYNKYCDWTSNTCPTMVLDCCDCLSETGVPGCEANKPCEAVVCSVIDEGCCDSGWDSNCVGYASDICNGP